MKPVNRNLADEFHRESEEGVDAVFDRMFKVVGKPPGGYGAAFDVSENTIKTWRRRGAVSTKFLQGFAKAYGVSIDYLMYGDRQPGEPELALTAQEKTLVEAFREAPREIRNAALRVLIGGSEPPAGGARKIKVSGQGNQVAGGKIINKSGGRK